MPKFLIEASYSAEGLRGGIFARGIGQRPGSHEDHPAPGASNAAKA
jgi:hypothetical protein